MNTQIKRIKLALRIYQALPWCNVTAGASGCRFIELDRGEDIVGSTRNSSWVRPAIGSRLLHWTVGKPIELYQQIVPVLDVGRVHSAFKLLQSFDEPEYRGRGWMDRTAAYLIDLAEQHLVPLGEIEAESQLRAGERFEIRVKDPSKGRYDHKGRPLLVVA